MLGSHVVTHDLDALLPLHYRHIAVTLPLPYRYRHVVTHDLDALLRWKNRALAPDRPTPHRHSIRTQTATVRWPRTDPSPPQHAHPPRERALS